MSRDGHFDDWGENDDENRGRISRVILKKVKDDGNQQLVDYDGVADESHTEVLRIQNHGFASNPPPGSEAMLVAANARDAPMVVGAEHPDHKPNLPSGGSRQYDTAGSMVDLDADGNVHVKAAGKKVIVDAATEVVINGASGIKLNGPMEFNGDIVHTGNMTTSGVHTDANGVHV